MPIKLTDEQRNVLAVLADSNAKSQTLHKLADVCGLVVDEANWATRALCDQGLAKREPGASKCFRITAEGHKVIEDMGYE